MELTNTHRPQLHISMLNMMSKCGIQFQRRYGARFDCWPEEEIVPPGIALVTGISVHKAVEANLKNKIESEGQLLPRTQVATIADDEFRGVWQGGMMLTEDEAANISKAFGSAVDQTVALALLHYDNLAPVIKPVAIEEKFVIKMDNYPYDLAGKKDIREANAIRDTKTARAKPADDAVRSMQMACYSLAEKIQRGKLPDSVKHDYLIKTKIPKAITLEAQPTMEWIDPLLRRIERAIEIIQSVKEGKGRFTPADPESWICQKKYCGFAVTCPYWSGK